MKVKRTQHPAIEAGEHISQLIEKHKGDSVVLLSGGSALNVFEYIKIKVNKSECRTIFIMVDERVSGEETVNNYLQLKARYRDTDNFDLVVDTSAKVNETLEDFATRIRKDFFYNYFNKLSNIQTIALLGVGPDGHTAGIFPLDEESFAKTYQADSTYVPVQVEGLKIDSRASFTPSWILNTTDVLIGYITGESKKEILNDLINEEKKVFERPAEILKKHSDSTIYTDVDVAKNDFTLSLLRD